MLPRVLGTVQDDGIVRAKMRDAGSWGHAQTSNFNYKHFLHCTTRTLLHSSSHILSLPFPLDPTSLRFSIYISFSTTTTSSAYTFTSVLRCCKMDQSKIASLISENHPRFPASFLFWDSHGTKAHLFSVNRLSIIWPCSILFLGASSLQSPLPCPSFPSLYAIPIHTKAGQHKMWESHHWWNQVLELSRTGTYFLFAPHFLHLQSVPQYLYFKIGPGYYPK